MEVGHDEERVMHLRVHWHGGKHEPGKAADHEHKKESGYPPHGQLELQSPFPDGGNPAEELDGRGYHDHQGCRGKKALSHLGKASGKHVVHPHAEGNESDADGRDYECEISEDMPPGKTGDQCGDDRRTRKKNDVNVRMAEKPEQMLVKQNIAAYRWIKELRSHGAIEQKHAARKHDRGHSEDHHEGEDQLL